MLHYGFYDSINRDRTYNAADMCRIFDGIITNGVFAGVGDKLALTVENTAEGMYVSVGTGMAWFDGTWSYNDAPILLEVQPNNTGSRRSDYIELIVDKRIGNQYSSYGRRNRIIISPNSMYVPETNEVFVHHLGYVSVDPGVTVISQSKITSFIGTVSCPYVTAAQKIELDEFTDAVNAHIELYLDNEVYPRVDLWFEDLIEDYLRNHPALTSVSLGDLGCGRATCSTASSSASKSVTIDGYKLIDGGKIAVYFEHAIAPNNAWLNVSDGANYAGSKPIYYRRSATLASGIVNDGDTVLMMYNASLNSGNGGYEIIAFDKQSSGSTKPDGGWTENDLHSDVQEKLNKTTSGYAACNTGASTAAKEVSIAGYKQEAGGIVAVKFTYKVNSGAKLKISPDGGNTYLAEKSIFHNGTSLADGIIPAGAIATFFYDGTRYNLIGINFSGNAIGTSSNNATAKTATIAGFTAVAGSIVAVRFSTYPVSANATLNINSIGPKNILYKNAAIAANVIKAGDTATFMYDGTAFHLLSIDSTSSSSGDNEDTIIITMTMSQGGTDLIASKGADEIYSMLSDGPVDFVLFDINGRECRLCEQPMPGSGQFSPAKFDALDINQNKIIVYSVYEQGVVSVDYITIPSSSPSGGSTTLPELGGGYAMCGGTGNTESTVARTATISGYVLTTGNGPTIKFTTAVNASNPTLNISNGSSNTGAKAIWYRGAVVPSGFITAGSLVKFVYDGTHYCIESIDKEFYVKEAAGIPQTDLAKLVVTVSDASGGAGYVCDTSLANILTANTSGKEIEIYYGTKKGHVLEIGATYVLFDVVVENNNSAKLLRFTISGTGAAAAEYPLGGSGSGYTGPTITTPTQAQNGYVLKANADGSTSWVSISSLLTAWTPSNPYGGGN